MVLTDELESKIYAFGARTDENIQDIQAKIKTLGGGGEKRTFISFFFSSIFIYRCVYFLYLGVKIFKERFIDVNFEELHIDSCKVILCNPPDSRSALIQPLDFLYNEGEGLIKIINNNKKMNNSLFLFLYVDVSLLKQFSQPTENKTYVKECIQRETAYMKQAVRCNKNKYEKRKDDYYYSIFRSIGKSNCLCNIFKE